MNKAFFLAVAIVGLMLAAVSGQAQNQSAELKQTASRISKDGWPLGRVFLVGLGVREQPLKLAGDKFSQSIALSSLGLGKEISKNERAIISWYAQAELGFLISDLQSRSINSSFYASVSPRLSWETMKANPVGVVAGLSCSYLGARPVAFNQEAAAVKGILGEQGYARFLEKASNKKRLNHFWIDPEVEMFYELESLRFYGNFSLSGAVSLGIKLNLSYF